MQKIHFFLKRHQLVLIAIAVTFFVHLTYLKAGFVWIDHNDIEEKQAVVALYEIPRAFATPFGQTSFYRPVVTIVNSFDYALYGTNPSGFHMTNLLLHLGVVIVAGLFLKLFFNLNEIQVFLARLFIGVHPMSILIVGAVTRRQETLAALFILLTLILYIQVRSTGEKWGYIIFASISFFLALLTKETSVVIVPALIVLWELTSENKRSRKVLRLWLFGVASIVFYSLLRLHAVPHVWNTKLPKMAVSEYFGTRVGLAGKWLVYSVNPFRPNFSDAVPVYSLFTVPVFFLTLLFSAIALFIFLHGYKSNLSKAIMLTGIFMTPGLAIIPVPRMGTPNYGYLTAIGLAGIVALLWWNLEKRWTRLSTSVAALWLLLASAVTFISGDQFKNDETLFKYEVQNAYFPEGHYFLGNYYLKKGEYAIAQKEFERGLIKDDSMLAFRNDQPAKINLATVTMQLGDNEKARELFLQTLENADDSQKALVTFNIALTFYNEGEYAKTVEALQSRDWNIPKAYFLLADTYDKLGNEKEKQDALTKAGSLQ